jgi:hypothetical protein
MGFLNHRLCMSALPSDVREEVSRRSNPADNHFARLGNDHLLVTALLDVCQAMGVPTLLELLLSATPRGIFKSTEKVAPCPEVYTSARVTQEVLLDVAIEKPVLLAYHTSHLTSDTGRMALANGAPGGHVESMVGRLHDRGDHYEIEPLVMGAPWYDHPRNGDATGELMWFGQQFGEILPEDIDQFSQMSTVSVASPDEWMDVMRQTPEEVVKSAFATLLNEPTKKDWGGEANDHFSGSVTIDGRRRTAAFLLKGPTQFREMTLDMCGKRADQILRLAQSGADISVVQNAHMVGSAVRETLRSLVVVPGRPRKYCVIDGQATYRIMKAYGFV